MISANCKPICRGGESRSGALLDIAPGLGPGPAPAGDRQAGARPADLLRPGRGQGLPDRIEHGPDKHGPASITMVRTASRRLDYPGA